MDVSRSIGVEETFMKFSFPEYILQRQGWRFSKWIRIYIKTSPFVLPPPPRNAIKMSFATKYTRPVSRKFVNLILLFISFLFSYPCALDVSVPPPALPPAASLMLHATVVKFLTDEGNIKCMADWYAEVVRRSGRHWVTKCWVSESGHDWWSEWSVYSMTWWLKCCVIQSSVPDRWGGGYLATGGLTNWFSD